MSTTDILFNSPALHSLKRAQLVQLCKRHNIKASGKNTELVARLQEHARALPSNTPLSVAVRSESLDATDISDEDDVEEQLESPEKERDSQVWEIVSRNGSVFAEDRGSVNSKEGPTSGQAGEFGTAGSSKSAILRSIASSIGLTRTGSSNSNLTCGESSDSLVPHSHKKDKDTTKSVLSSSPGPRSALSSLLNRSRCSSHESQSKTDSRNSLITNAKPYNEIPMPSISRRPHVEPFAFSYDGVGDTSLDADVSMSSIDRPVPGVGPCSSVNVNDGLGTIRLITSTNKPPGENDDAPKLTPVIPAFDLVPPTPGNNDLKRWPVSNTPEVNRTLYPTINSDDMNVDLDVLSSPSKEPSKNIDKTLPDLPPVSPISPTSPRDAFIFGSPNPRHSTAATDFSHAASSVLAEMNARLGVAGERAIGTDVLSHAPRTKLAVDELLKYEFGGAAGKKQEGKDGVAEETVTSKFDRAHEKMFNRMDGIDTHYAAKRVLKEKEQKGKEKEEKLEPLPDNRKRKQSVFGSRKSAAAAPSKKQETNAVKKKANRVVIPGAFEEDDMDAEDVSPVIAEENYNAEEEEEEKQRGAKRACVAEPAADGNGETRRVSIAPKVRKNISDDVEDVDEEKKRKQNEAIKRKLELNKARRRSTRGRPSMGSRAPAQKQRGFLASAKSFVKSVWNRSGSSAASKSSAQTSIPSYLKPTAASASKNQEQDETKPTPVIAIGARPSVTRVSSVRGSSVGSGNLYPKASTSQPRSISGSRLDTVAEDAKTSTDASSQTEKTENQNAQGSGPSIGRASSRKSTVTPLARTPSGSKGLTATPAAGRTSRLLAPTASSLAKANASPTKSAASNASGGLIRSKVPSVRGHTSVLSPSKIPVISPPQKKSNTTSGSGGGANKGIFRSPLVLPTSPQARLAAEKGQDVNPITGATTTKHRLPFSSANGQTQSLSGAALAVTKGADVKIGANKGRNAEEEEDGEKEQYEPRKINNTLNALRKPRISRSKVIARLGAHRDQSGPVNPRSPAKTRAGPSSNVGTGKGTIVAGGKGPATPKVRSSTGAAARRSLGGPKARETGANGVIMSAKKRARATDYARRQSAKVTQPDFKKGGEAMEVDD
ncbi:uncharacterized protein FOMMEDRAFT_168412 [Fomitiporia mediterranea MF3/22]|uniref:uncharacterized protein n=1 Tax=Fomitiporia mediterranea (strain MF3/22) TaxID=694068 RepID=UPI00044084FF|nr:uncharacterized protein FOMMEDRAFT_168412 [Fomitiporia mediterranea MF3/22]EJD01791.1 hypothetical protein FOMMEDRAFT_168412 [Fomitiporia mediterranea MF3/22]